MPYLKAVLRVAALLVCTLFTLPALAYDDIEIKSWTAPPYWISQQAAAQDRAEPGGREALASGRQPLGGAASTPMPFVAVTPCRVADTRAGSGFTGDYGQPALQAQVTRPFVIAGQCGIPAAAQAVSFLFTAVNMTATGNFRVFPSGASMPAAGGVLVWAATTPYAVENSAIEPLGGSPGAINVYLNGGLGTSADLVIDVNGYYSPVGIVNSVNTLTGDVTLAAGSNVSVTPSGNTLTIAATNSGGTVTSVGTGAGLTGGPITTTGTLSVPPQGITTGMLADGAVTAAKLAPGVPSTPYFPGNEFFASMTGASSAYVYGPTLNIGTSTKCMVTTQPIVPTALPAVLAYGAWRVNGTTTNHQFNPWCFFSDAVPGGSYFQCSNTGIVQPTGSASNTYDFGCFIQLGPTSSGSVYCHVTVICFP